MMQVVEIVTWNKNLHADQDALGCAEDIGEAEPDLVPVPWAQWWCGHGRAIDVLLGEPDDEAGVEQSDKRGHAQHGSLFARLRVRKAKQLLGVPEEDLDAPPARVGYPFTSQAM